MTPRRPAPSDPIGAVLSRVRFALTGATEVLESAQGSSIRKPSLAAVRGSTLRLVEGLESALRLARAADAVVESLQHEERDRAALLGPLGPR